MIVFWKGFHSQALREQIRKSWASGELLIVCPPFLSDFSFLNFLPAGEIKIFGENASDFPDSFHSCVRARKSIKANAFPESPRIGVFTSGTLSGVPRLVLYSESNIRHSLSGIRSFFETNRLKEIFCYPPPFHTFGLILGYLHSILYDLPLHFLEGRYSRQAHALRAANTNPSLLTLGAPSHFYDFLQEAKSQVWNLLPTYSCIIGGAKTSVALWQQIKNEMQIEAPSIGYGATEACPGVTHLAPGIAPTEEGEIGVALPGVQINILPNQGLEFSGPSVCLAIITSEGIEFPHKILLADEMVERASDHRLIFQGRYGLIINRGGTKFSIESLEEIFLRELGLRARVIKVDDLRLGEDIGILVEENSTSLSIEEIRIAAAQLLQQKYGYRFEFPVLHKIAKIALNENGKINRTQDLR